MRKNMARVIAAFIAGRPHGEPSCSTDGQTVFSYGTAIATRTADGRIILNATKYSPTTSRQQHALRMHFTADITVDNVRRGASRNALLDAAADTATSQSKNVMAFEIVDHGVDHAQYFQGCGVSFTDFTDVATGAADNAKEAYEEAIEQLVGNGWNADGFPSRPRGISKRSKVPAAYYKNEENETYYYVSVRVR